MIYRHYKGGVYYFVGTASRIWNIKTMTGGVEASYPANLITDDGFVEVEVSVLKDSRTGYICYVIDSEYAKGSYIIYKSTSGQLWLRQKEDFNAVLADGTPRFKRMSNEEVFDFVAETLMQRIVE